MNFTLSGVVVYIKPDYALIRSRILTLGALSVVDSHSSVSV